jgi:protein phosphatase 1 regulatory subunit 7
MLTMWQEIENIDHLTALEELWLGKNKITELKVDG